MASGGAKEGKRRSIYMSDDLWCRAEAVAEATSDRLGKRVTVSGLISEGLSHGPIVGADIFRPVSYGYDPATGLGFKVATLDITGGELLKGMEICLANVTNGDTYDLQFSGLSYRYDSRKAPGQRVVPGSVYVHGRPLRPERTYSLTVNEGIAMLLPRLGVAVSNLKVRDDFEYYALRDYIEELHLVRYTPQGRIHDVGVRHRHCRF